MTRGMAGMDPLSDLFTQEALDSLARRHAELSVRAFLLDHDVFTRVTADHAARIVQQAQVVPERPVGQLSSPETYRLYRAIRDVLGRALEGHHGYDP